MKSLTFFAFFCSTSLLALPSGGQVIRGNAVLTSSSDHTLSIHADGKAILQWEGFDIGSQESVRFMQSQSGQPILNRVDSSSTSQILGYLQSNCPIFLINPKGVLIGGSALIDTAGFLAATSDLSNDGFWDQSSLLFQELGDGSIVNLGKIKSSYGDVVLIARFIDQQGEIQAKQGFVTLASSEIMLDPDTKETRFIRCDAERQEKEGISNTGKIQALAVEMKTQSPYEKAIHHEGLIEAITRAVDLTGRIYLVADQGGCVLDGSFIADGGDIKVSALELHLTSEALLDVSSNEQGGCIHLDHPAQSIHVEKGARLCANSKKEGNGGDIVLAAEKELVFYGLAEACGGEFGGDGGTIHLSSSGSSFQLSSTDPIVKADAPKGCFGTVIFDPKFVTISPEGMDLATGNTFASNPSDSVIISGATLQSALDSANVVIQANTDIVFQDAVTASTPGNSLTLQAGRSISMDGTLTLQAADFIASINDSGALLADRDTGVASFQLSNSASIATEGGNITIDVGTFGGSQEGEIYISGGMLDAGGGNIAITGLARQDGSDSAYGISVGMGSILQTTNLGTISLQGTGGNGANYNVGIYLGGGILETDAGLLQLTGVGGGNGLGNGCVGIYSAAQVGSTSSGSVVFQGTAGTGVHGNMGIYFSQGIVNTVNGNITLQGNGSGSGGLNSGIRFETGSQCICSGTGGISLSGMSGLGKNNNHGVILSGGLLQADTGPISITGTGQGSANYNYGIRFEGDIQCISTGTSTISLNGLNTSGVDGNIGVSISTFGTAITSAYGNIQVTGTSGGAGLLNQGVRLESGQIVSTGQGVGSATIHLTGVGSMGTDFCNGVAIQGMGMETGPGGNMQLSGTVVTSIDGNIILEGTGQGSGQGNQPFDIDPNSLIESTGSGKIMYIAH